ncbi:Hypothetical predicted protein [Lecanosticta acicola]|uniref:Uncharacterized protein n=1 Tax=Lecanosticta acicola TaxID=111012 RepID=A0AAI8YY08_9PEZI|nr:Hypothetical predicted protein [Lecanosticta acicola]
MAATTIETPPDPVATYNLLRTPGSAADTFSIHQPNGATLHASKKSHKLGSDELIISQDTTSDALVAAKLKASSKKCEVKFDAKGDWQTVASIDDLGTAYAVGKEGRVWRRLNKDSTGKISELSYGDMQLHESTSSQGSPLAIYYLHSEGSRNAEGTVQIGQLDFSTDSLGREYELQALIAVLGLMECRRLDIRSRNLPLQKGGVFPNSVPGPTGWK